MDNAINGETPSVDNGYPLGEAIKQQLNNPDNAAHKVIYHITPWTIRADNSLHCAGDLINIDIWVEPTPRLSVTPSDTIICDSAIVTFDVSDQNGFTAGGKFYYLTTTYNPLNVSGVEADGEKPAGTDFTDQLVNLTNEVQTVQYRFKARINDPGINCESGTDTIITVYVQPTPRLSVAIADTIVCDSTIINIAVTDGNGNVHPSTTKVYQLTTTDAGGNVQGVQPTGEYTAGTLITDQLINLTNAVQTVTYHFKAKIRDDRPGHGGFFCDEGGDTLIVVYVEPTARVTGTISNDTICNITSITYSLSTPNSPLYGIRHNVIVINPYPEISGYTTPRSDLPAITAINETLTNTGDTARMIMYIITPATINGLGIQNCPGVNDTIRLWVNPTPRATPINHVPEMCYGESTRIELNSPTVMTKGIIRFNYTIEVSDTDVVGNMIPMTDRQEGLQLIYPYVNDSDTINSVYYHITPTNNESGCINGPVNTDTVKVHPHPVQVWNPPMIYTCSGPTMGVLRAVLSRGSKPDRIYWDRPEFIGDTVYYTTNNTDSLRVRYTGTYSLIVNDSFNCQWSSPQEVVEGAVYQTTMYVEEYPTGFGTQCPGDANGHIRIIEDFGSTGVPPFNYWLILNNTDTVRQGIIPSLGSPTDIYGLRAGHYNLSLRDYNGCFNDVSNKWVDLTEPDPITVTFETKKYGTFDVSCKGYNDGHVWIKTLTGGNDPLHTENYKFKWFTYDGLINPLTTPDTLNRLDSIPAGKYYLLTTDQYCTKLDSVTLIEGSGMSLSDTAFHLTSDLQYNISCNGGSDGTIDITVAGASGAYTTQWTGPGSYISSNEDITGLSAGTYTVAVTDNNGCILKTAGLLPSFTLDEPPPLKITPVLSNSLTGPYNINCNGGTGSIDITVAGGSGPGTYLYDWTATGGGSGLIAGQANQGALTAGSYNLEVTDLYGCSVLFDTTLTEPDELSATLVPKHITCSPPGMNNGEIDLIVTGGTAPYSYEWSNLETSEDLTGLTAGIYSVEITDANSCQLTVSTEIKLPPPLRFSYELSEHNGFNISCFEGSNGRIKIKTSSGAAPFVFSWTSPSGFTSSLPEISGLPAAEYNLHITDSNSCTADTTFILNEPGEFYMNFDLSTSTSGGYNINCHGESTGSINVVPVNAVGVVRYLWNDGSTLQLRENLPAGTYEVILSDANFCIARDTVSLTEPPSLQVIFSDTISPLCPDKPDGSLVVTAAGGAPAYAYVWSDGSTGNEITDIKTGWYSVVVSDFNGCSIRDSIYLEPQNDICLNIPNAISPNGDLINDEWNIGEIELYPDIEIKIFDSWGILVWQSARGYPQRWDGTSRGRKLPIDSYHYIIDLHNNTKPIIGNITIVR